MDKKQCLVNTVAHGTEVNLADFHGSFFFVNGRVGAGPRLKVTDTSGKARYFSSNTKIFCCLRKQNLYIILHNKAEISAKTFRNCIRCYVQKTQLFWKCKVVHIFLSRRSSEHEFNDLIFLYSSCYLCSAPFNLQQWVSLILGYRLEMPY